LVGLLSFVGCHISHEDPATSFNQVYAEFLHGQLDLALQTASSEKTKLVKRDPTWSYKFQLLEAEIYEFQGKSRDVVKTIDDPTVTFTPTGDLAIKQQLLMSLANARLGHPQLSSDELRQAQNLSRAAHSALEGEVLRLQGLLENRSGKHLAAEQSLLSSLAFAREHGDAYLEGGDLLNLGYVALQSEHIDEALERFNSAAQIADKIHANVLLQSDLGNAGWAYYDLGDFDRALQSFQRAAAQAHSCGATDGEIRWLRGAGLSLSRLGNHKQAQSYYEQALQASLEAGDPSRVSEIESALALLFLQLKQFDLARARADDALKSSHEVGDTLSILDASLVRALVEVPASDSAEVERALLQVVADSAEAPSIRWQAQNALANLYATEHLNQQADLWHRKSIATLETQRTLVRDEEQRLPFLANGDDLYRDYAEFLIATRRSDDALHLLDGARAKTLKESLGNKKQVSPSVVYGPSAITRQGVGVILFYSLGPQRSYLWAVDRGGTHLFTLPTEAEITARINRYQEAILKSRDPLADANVDALWLYDKLVAPADAIVANDSRVLVIPDGSLNGLNFETLLKRTPQGIHYWIDDVSLTTAASFQLLSSASPEVSHAAVGKLLLIGDPLPAGGEYTSLTHAPAELANVEHYFPAGERTTLARAAAVPSAYAAAKPDQYAYLHFVAHGMASSERPLDSAIVLSPPPNDPDHFKLYARDILAHPLHARLVTISACYGSGVRNYASEGMVGLTWAFLSAGAHQVIGTLWEVNDSSTPQLMQQMYQGLSEGQTPDKALRAAKLSMVHSQGVFRKPLYWAPFQLYTGS
jgi:CHAT domain-containing protein/Tfp pilus assembly protein PilF